VNAVYDARTRVLDLNLFSEADVDKTAEIYFGADPENRLSVCSTQAFLGLENGSKHSTTLDG
jgi:hypothetical protein